MFSALRQREYVRTVLIGMAKGNNRNIDRHLMDSKGFLKK